MNAGGAERVALTLLQHLDRRDFSYTLVVLDDGNGAFIDRVPDDVRLITLGKKRVRAALFALIRLVWKERPALIFSNLSHLNLMLAMLRFMFPRDCALVVRESSTISKNILLFRASRVWLYLYKLFYGNVDVMICESVDMKDDLTRTCSFPVSKCTIIPNPVDILWINEQASLNISERQQKLTLVACGQLYYTKGFDLLLDALALAKLVDFELWIIGEGALRTALVQKAIALGLKENVKFLGFQKNPYPFFNQADALVLSSRHEGMPNVVFEAVSLGTPIIATPASGGLVSFLNTIDGCIVCSDITAQSLANALREFAATDTKIRISDGAINYLAAPIISRQHEAEFRKVLACD
ncbi:glycosyl transferase, group 1 [Candidatus Puniceispirillum marinum IMCC1322]|uniref:Glycosyl transferase, group 1 n=2 Tax=Candidatus Puniceispirillum TaxID=767891 RepID=D5BN08_PUNMI|nr:glycosyl transferase, group 1 [Candidatus Puniceispirillum marinum IMCC1322]